MKHWGVYGRPGFEGASAFAAGVFALGERASIRSVSDYRAGETEDFDVIAVFGLQGNGPMVTKDYRALGVPVLIIDYGYLKRTNHAHDWRTGHWQVSLNALNVLPDYDEPSRFESLGIEIAEQGGRPDGHVLLCVQTTGDASHGMGQEELQIWCNEQRLKWHDLRIRPHPLQPQLTYGLPIDEAKTLDEALSQCRLMVTGNSNSGHEALLKGVPAIATVPGAAWASLSSKTLPSKELRLKHFRRAAWGQWTWDEMRTGRPQNFLRLKVLCWPR